MADNVTFSGISNTTTAYSDSTAAAEFVLISTTDYLFIITFILRYIQTVLSFIGNSLVLIAIYRFQYLRTPTGWLICGLSMSNLMLTALIPITHYLRYPEKTLATQYVCHVKIMLMSVYNMGNYLFSFLIGLERLITLSYPLLFTTIITDSRAIKVFIGAWVVLLANTLSIPIFAYQKIMSLGPLECLPSIMMSSLHYSIMSVQIYGCILGKHNSCLSNNDAKS